MQVLLTEIMTADARAVAARLEAAGHNVVSCHEPGDTGTLCSALRGRPCPLEADLVDIAVDVRTIPVEDRLPLEEGIRCAVRRRVPLVVAGAIERNPYAAWAATQTEGLEDIVAAVEEAASRPLAAHGEAASAFAGAPVVVYRRLGGLRATVVSPEAAADPHRANAVAVRAAAALRAFDPTAKSIDVSVVASDN